MRWEAVIFDLDGVICSTDMYHYLAWKALTDRLGLPFDLEINNRLRGVSRMDSLDIILESSGRSFTQDEKNRLAAEKNEEYRALLTQMSPADLAPEVRFTLDTLRSLGLKLAIGSSSMNAPLILSRLGLGGYFDALSDGNGITRSKPDPEVFLRAASLLGMNPERCLVVEDAVAGVEAAHAGGMQAASVGDAAEKGVGDFILRSIAELPAIIAGTEGAG